MREFDPSVRTRSKLPESFFAEIKVGDVWIIVYAKFELESREPRYTVDIRGWVFRILFHSKGLRLLFLWLIVS